MLIRAIKAYKRWQYRGGRPQRWARIENRLMAIASAAGIMSKASAALEIRGRKSGRLISFPVAIADYQGERYLVAMLGEKTNWALNARADGHGVLRHGRREEVLLVEDFSDHRAAILRRYLEVAPGARPHFPVDRRASLEEFERIVGRYPVFRITPASTSPTSPS